MNCQWHCNIGTYPDDPSATLRLQWMFSRYTDGATIISIDEQYSCPPNDRHAFAWKVAAIIGRFVEVQFVDLAGSPVDSIVSSKELFCRVLEVSRAGSKERVFIVTISGDPKIARRVKAALDDNLRIFRSATVKWWYMTKDGPSFARLVLDEPLPIEPAMYPLSQFAGDPMDFLRRYHESRATVLFMIGPPGTGKTSLLRRFIYENEIGAAVAYDEEVMRNDSMFINFLDDEKTSVLVLEDVTELLQDRGVGRNELMARFLNVSDGLIQFPNKKIVFTTNMASLERIDPALMRAGRCFGVLEFRDLNRYEAAVACEAAGLPPFEGDGDVPMSELYNRSYEAPIIPSIAPRKPMPIKRAG